jgi:ppGpp synthetase/RelA/SpoT-type nucleotidyltranferase
MEPFKTPEGMLAALHDFGGTRISLYFPGDIERVVSIIQARLNVIRRIDKGRESQTSMRGLEERLQSLHVPENKVDSREVQKPIRTFPGYKATHLHVKLRDEDIQESQGPSLNDVVIEIQVGSLVMHVWSEIEHDMIYKPLDCQGDRVSEDEERILDLINGIVLTGEAALRQLEASTAKRLDQRARDKDMKASNHYELATWIEKDCDERGWLLESEEWGHLEHLFVILKTAGEDKHHQVTELLEYSTDFPASYRQSLLVKMLRTLCEQTFCLTRHGNIDYNIAHLGQEARCWALLLVHSLNLAIYLGVVEEFLNVESLPEMPSISTFLDILHPGRPTFSSVDTAESIITPCKALLCSRQGRGKISDDLVRVAMDLPVTNLVVTFDETYGPGTTLVPCIIGRLFQVDGETEEVAPPAYMSYLHHAIDFIDFYLSVRDSRADKIVLWDRLTGKSHDPEHKLSTEYRCFGSHYLRK